MRLTFTDDYSDEVDNTVSDTFLVIIKNYCTINALSISESLGVLLQYVTDPISSGYTLNMSATQPSCTLTYTLEFWDETDQIWYDYSTNTAKYPFVTWDSATGELKLQTNDYTSYDNYSVQARITALDEYSEVDEPLKSEVYDQFTVELRDECHDIQTKTAITITRTSDGSSATQSSPFEFDLWEQQDMTISKLVYENRFTSSTLAHDKCPVDYQITDSNAERS